jgi:UDP-glucose 4-epimerase
MKALVTGGAGFIGSHLARKLMSMGWEVAVFDRNAPRLDGVRYIRGDVTKIHDLRRIGSGYECVFHLAAYMGVEATEREKLLTMDINLLGTRNILEICKKKGMDIVFSSSSEYYGEPRRVPISENEVPSPKSVYGVSKVAAESYIRAYSEKYNFGFSIVRFFNVYGPGQSTKFVIPKFVDAALKGDEICVFGSGRQIRAFCYVEDAVNGVMLAYEKGMGDVFNIGNSDEPISILKLAKRVVKLSGSKSKITLKRLEEGMRGGGREIVRRIPDISKARRALGYEPKVSLDEGIKRVIEYFRGM